MRKYKYSIYILLILFLLSTILTITGVFTSIDEEIYQFLISFRDSRVDSFYKVITMLANTSSVIILTTFLFFLIKEKERYVLLSSIILTVTMNLITKFFIQRPRPEHLRMIVEKGFSFPSGHAMISIALYGFMIYYICLKESNKLLKYMCILFLIFLIFMIGCSRIYLGVHYPSDVFSGYLLSLSILIGVIYYWGKKYDKDGCK